MNIWVPLTLFPLLCIAMRTDESPEVIGKGCFAFLVFYFTLNPMVVQTVVFHIMSEIAQKFFILTSKTFTDYGERGIYDGNYSPTAKQLKSNIYLQTNQKNQNFRNSYFFKR